MNIRRPSVSLIGIATLVLVFIGAEAYLRYAGLGSYPLYELDDEIKYIPAANQQGVFLNTNAWFFNDRHMGDPINWMPERHPNLLLIGNSVVLGGLPYDHKDKLGPLLETSLGGRYKVWSVAAGGWTDVNEMVYLERNPDILQNSDAVILEYMYGGLSQPTPWPGYFIFPDQKAWILTSYVFGKYVLPRFFGRATNDSGSLPPTGAATEEYLRKFKALVASIAKTRKLVIFMYPGKPEFDDKAAWSKIIAPILEICKTYSLTCIDIAKEKAWSADLYRDTVHPTVAGNKVLAAALAAAIENKN